MTQHVAGRGADILAAGAPLQVIIRAVLASLSDSSSSSSSSSSMREASQIACNLIATSKGFQQAVSSLQGLLPVEYGPPASAKQAAAFAAWLSRHGPLLSKLDQHDKLDSASNLSPEQQAAAEQAIAAALREAAAQAAAAAAAAAPELGAGLHITSCKMECGQPESANILQALPGSTLTSLTYSIKFPEGMPAEVVGASIDRVGQALAGLHQLRQMDLFSQLSCYEDV
ncbi:hypothetical protein COO60DRAFT_343418 [Scenedesmus sp. NREL 46B-D3]|nr:hypothetical protein COO60DRAFT_343418 [Scenedesmus sp. NREL 46B-D3]